MLTRTFVHLPGVGPVFEQKLNQRGIFTWDDAMARPLPCGPAKAGALRALLLESRDRLAAGDAAWFGSRLPPAGQWRLFPHFRHAAAYVDIETNGLAGEYAYITTIALYDGQRVRTYVRGRNLEAFSDDILAYKLLVTWNGRCFDAPILRQELNIPLDKPCPTSNRPSNNPNGRPNDGPLAHLDLLPVFRALGLRGGLKAVESRLGLDRGGLSGLDGWDAVRLWRAYDYSGESRFLETLLAYNVADVLSLERLAEYACLAHSGREPAPELAPVRHDLNPHAPDPEALRRTLAGAALPR